MTNKKYISQVLNSIFLLTLLLFVLDVFTVFEIKNQPIKSFVYIGIIALAPLILIWHLWFFKSSKRKIINAMLPLLTLIGILFVGPIEILFSSSSWKTQKVLYQSENTFFNKTEIQTQDVGALGTNKRTVEVAYLTNWFMIVKPITKSVSDDTIKSRFNKTKIK